MASPLAASLSRRARAESLAATIIVMLAGSLLAPAAQAESDNEAGEMVFKRCLVCHSFAAGQPNRLGPNLHGLFARPAGKAPGFEYSAGLAAAQFNWDDQKLAKWLENPEKFIPGTTMSFQVDDGSERADVIAYLHGVTK
jgi:cytochrome c